MPTILNLSNQFILGNDFKCLFQFIKSIYLADIAFEFIKSIYPVNLFYTTCSRIYQSNLSRGISWIYPSSLNLSGLNLSWQFQFIQDEFIPVKEFIQGISIYPMDLSRRVIWIYPMNLSYEFIQATWIYPTNLSPGISKILEFSEFSKESKFPKFSQ